MIYVASSFLKIKWKEMKGMERKREMGSSSSR
jgi:hypothetical protein